MIAKALSHFGANIFYHAGSRKTDLEAEYGFTYLPLDDLLKKVDILCCCLNKNTILLHQREFDIFGNQKILINTSIGPAYDLDAVYNWLNNSGNFLLTDHLRAVGFDERVMNMPNLLSPNISSGMTAQARKLLGQKVIENIREFLEIKP
jgi:lactate dehydrogenase-like 2-hydroxyacid dehydrogenase